LEISTFQNLIKLSISTLELQQSFGVEINKGFSVVSMHLSSQDMEVVGGGRARHYIDINRLKLLFIADFLFNVTVVIAKLEESFDPARAVLGTLPVHTVRQIHDNTRGLAPLGLSACDEIVNHNLSSVSEITELGLPNNQGVLVGD
jgi:hypothetical protein